MPSQEEIAHQQTLLTTYRRTLAHYLKQQAALGEAYAPPAVAHGIAEARNNIQRIKRTLRGWNVPVDDYPDDGDDVPAPPPPDQSAPPAVPVDRVRLRQVLTDYFNEDELRDLCFDLGIDYESLPGNSKAGKARELVAFAERRGRFEELVGHARRVRPNAGW